MDILIYLGIFAVLLFLSILLSKQKQTRVFAVCILLTAVLFEVFAANFHSFHLVGSDCKETEIDFSSDSFATTAVNPSSPQLQPVQGQNSMTMTISNINAPVGTVFIDCILPASTFDSAGTPAVEVTIDATDDTHMAYYRYKVATGTIIRDDERSSHIVLDLSGNVSELRITVSASEGELFAVKGITLNSAVPFKFSPIRLLLLFGFAVAAYALINFSSLQKSYKEEQLRFSYIAIGLTAAAVFGAILLAGLSNYDSFRYFSPPLILGYGNQLTQELVDAFKAGQVSLLSTPSEELLAMENPYDWSARTDIGVDCLWDHLLYEGKYYSYYGIAPVLLLFLPFNLITGGYMSSFWAVLLFGSLGIVFLSLAYVRFCEIFAKKLPLNILISTLVILQISSGIWFCFPTPQFYEIAQTSGFMFTAAGFWLLLESGVLGGGKIKCGYIALSVFCQATAVLCRPTLALYCVVSLVALAFGFIRRKTELAEESDKKKRREYIKYLASALLLYAVIGSVQMVYNYVRFGSFLDFGIQYSLTINDFTRSQYATDFVMIGFYNFLLAFPVIKPVFPYIFSNYSTLDVNGYYFTANIVAVGLPFRALPTLGLFGAGKALKLMSKEEKLKALLFGLPTALLIPLAIIFSIWESGYGVRYCCDFAWEMVLGGAGVLYLLYVRAFKDNETMKRITRGFFIVSMFAAIAVNFSMIYDYLDLNHHLEALSLTYERLFDFMK